MKSYKIGFIYTENTKINYEKLRQINTYLPVDLIPKEFGSTLIDELPTLINKLEESVRELYNQGIRKFLLNGSSSIFINWALGKFLQTNENIYCDKIERWVDCQFFIPNNSMSYEGNTLNIFLIVRNLYRFSDITSGQSVEDIILCLNTEIFKDISLPNKIFEIIQVGDNASGNSINNLNEALVALDIVSVKIPVKLVTDPDPIKQEKFGGLFEFINGSEHILNDWISILNTSNETVGLSIAVNGGLTDAFTNTFLNTNLNLLNLDTGLPVNATLYEICQDITNSSSIFGGNPTVLNTRNIRNKLIGTNYTYFYTNNATETNPDVPPLAIAQFNNTFNPLPIFNPILSKVSGELPGKESNEASITSAQIEMLEYILADLNVELDVFNGVSDNRFRFDLTTGRSRISALLAYSYLPANTFNTILSGIRLNKDDSP